jgi:P-type E1-E2 ATPase
MAGNGSNDTYALRKADISISMACTDNESAKEASDIVFLDDNFESVISTIQWGRHTFNSVRKFLILQLTINLVAAVMALLGAVLLGESPLNPLQMCWTNVIIDLIGSLALITE